MLKLRPKPDHKQRMHPLYRLQMNMMETRPADLSQGEMTAWEVPSLVSTLAKAWMSTL